jgi:hypothetical protein
MEQGLPEFLSKNHFQKESLTLSTRILIDKDPSAKLLSFYNRTTQHDIYELGSNDTKVSKLIWHQISSIHFILITVFDIHISKQFKITIDIDLEFL